MTWLLALTLLGISMACAFYGTSLLVWTFAMTAGFVILAATGSVSVLSLVVIGLIFAAIAVPLNFTPWRQLLISGPFLKQFRRMLPEISETEQVALDAGTVGWEGQLFAGRPDWKLLKNQPYLGLTVEEQAFLDGPVGVVLLPDPIPKTDFTAWLALQQASQAIAQRSFAASAGAINSGNPLQG